MAVGRYPHLPYLLFAAVMVVGSASAALLASVPTDVHQRRYALAVAVTLVCVRLGGLAAGASGA